MSVHSVPSWLVCVSGVWAISLHFVNSFRPFLAEVFPLTFVFDLAFAFALLLLLSCVFVPFRFVVGARPSTCVVVLYASVPVSTTV